MQSTSTSPNRGELLNFNPHRGLIRAVRDMDLLVNLVSLARTEYSRYRTASHRFKVFWLQWLRFTDVFNVSCGRPDQTTSFESDVLLSFDFSSHCRLLPSYLRGNFRPSALLAFCSFVRNSFGATCMRCSAPSTMGTDAKLGMYGGPQRCFFPQSATRSIDWWRTCFQQHREVRFRFLPGNAAIKSCWMEIKRSDSKPSEPSTEPGDLASGKPSFSWEKANPPTLQ